MTNPSEQLEKRKANWDADSSRKIGRKFIITGTLVLDTPASFSNGESNGTEMIILEDALEHRPLLPGASIAGALRHYIREREKGYRNTDDKDDKNTIAGALFGTALDEQYGQESRVIVHDALGQGSLTRREGVKIDGSTRTADEGMLFSTQVWEAGTSFDLRFELMLYDTDEESVSNKLISALSAALIGLGESEIPMGGRKHRGYGRVHAKNWQVSFYEMNKPQALAAWLKNDMPNNATDDFFDAAHGFMDNRQYVRIEASLKVLDSILIRVMSDVADTEHLTSNDNAVLSGTSLAGALRARALKIANTINHNAAEKLINDLFGRHGADGNTEDLTASRLIVEEHKITGGEFNLVQNRVKIDRFTGGAFETALFDERPLFSDGQTFVQVNLELRYPADHNLNKQLTKAESEELYKMLDAETGLLLLLLKDLWTEDLALGGESSIGRGRLHGDSAYIGIKLANNPEPIVISLDEDGLTDESKQHMADVEAYVKGLWQYMGGK